MGSLQLDNDEILRAVAIVAGFDRDSSNWTSQEQEDARAIIRAGLRGFFHPLPIDGGQGHQWRFLERMHVMSGEAAFSDGTVEIVSGVVTLTGGTFPSWADDGILRIAGQSHFVESRDSGTQVTLTDLGADVDSGTSYELHRWREGLPSDFGELLDGAVYSDSGSSRPVGGATEQEIRLRYATNFKRGNTSRFAVFHGNDSDASDWYISVWPVMADATFLTVPYRAVPADNLAATITDDGNTVQIDAVHAETLIASIMAAAEEYYNDEPNGVHKQRYLQRLMASIKHDRMSQGPTASKAPDGVDPRAYSLLNHTPTYNDLL